MPALALIHNGQLLDLLVRGISKDEFGSRIRNAFGGDSATSERVGAEQTSTTEPLQVMPSSTTTATATQVAAPPATAETLRREREARIKAKGKQRQEDPPAPQPVPSETAPASTARNDWLEQQRQRKSEARRERERVMAQIEADKAERRARRELERAAREQSTQSETTSSPITSQLPSKAGSRATSSKLQVRLLDGGTIRKQFPVDASLEIDVRPWIDSHLETKAPYTFKQILAPQPARAISVSEEHSSLRELELLPSATLVLQPVQTYSDAYAPSEGGLLSMPYNVVTGAYGLVSGTISGAADWLRGGLFRPEEGTGGVAGHMLGQASQQEVTDQDTNQADEQPTPRANASRSNVRIRTLADQRDGAVDQQFYNGNSLDFEPNTDDSEKR